MGVNAENMRNTPLQLTPSKALLRLNHKHVSSQQLTRGRGLSNMVRVPTVEKQPPEIPALPQRGAEQPLETPPEVHSVPENFSTVSSAFLGDYHRYLIFAECEDTTE